MTSTLKSNHHRPIDQMIRSTPKRARNFYNQNQQSGQSSSTLSCSVILVRRAHRKFHHRIGRSQASLAPMTTSWLICPLSRALDLQTQKKLVGVWASYPSNHQFRYQAKIWCPLRGSSAWSSPASTWACRMIKKEHSPYPRLGNPPWWTRSKSILPRTVWNWLWSKSKSSAARHRRRSRT